VKQLLPFMGLLDTRNWKGQSPINFQIHNLRIQDPQRCPWSLFPAQGASGTAAVQKTQHKQEEIRSLHSVQMLRGSWCYAKALELSQLAPVNSILAHLGINIGQKPFLTGIPHAEEGNLKV